MTIKPENFESNKMSFEHPVKQTTENYTSDISYLSGDIIIQTPKTSIISVKNDTILIDISCDKLYNFFGDFDQSVISALKQNSNVWFSQELTTAQCQEIYKRSVISPFKKNDSVTMTLKLIDTNIYNKQSNNMTINDIKENDDVICLIKCSKLIFYRSYCVPCWEAIQIKVKEKKVQSEYLIKDLETDNTVKKTIIPLFPEININLKE